MNNKNITRGQAICIFFCEKYTEANMEKLLRKMETFEEVDICYENNPLKPLIQSNAAVDSESSKYKRYK